MAKDTYEDLKSQYYATLQSNDLTTRVAELERLRTQLREFCIANGKDLRELDTWLANQLDEWAGYSAG